MLGAIRDVVPRRRIGTMIAVFGASGPIGFAVGPILGGWLVDGLGWPLPSIFWVSAGLSVATGALVWFGSPEVRPPVVPAGRVLPLAYGALRGVLGDPTVRRIFAIYGVAFLANQMSRPYQALIVESDRRAAGPGLASSIGFVAGTAALGRGGDRAARRASLGDRIGFRPVLLGALFVGGFALLAVPLIRGDPAAGRSPSSCSPPPTASSGRWSSACSRPRSRPSAARRRSTSSTCRCTRRGSSARSSAARSSAVAGPTGPFWAGAVVFLVGAVVVALAGPDARGPADASAEPAPAT